MSSVSNSNMPQPQTGITDQPKTSWSKSHPKIGDYTQVKIGIHAVPIKAPSAQIVRTSIQPNGQDAVNQASGKTLSSMLLSIKSSVGKLFKTSLSSIKNLAASSKNENPKILEKQSQPLERPKSENEINLAKLHSAVIRLSKEIAHNVTTSFSLPEEKDIPPANTSLLEETKVKKEQLSDELKVLQEKMKGIDQQIKKLKTPEKINEKTTLMENKKTELQSLKDERLGLIKESNALAKTNPDLEEVDKHEEKIIVVSDAIIALGDEIKQLSQEIVDLRKDI